MEGNIFITTPTTGSNKNRSITIEGTLRNDGASGSTYNISGTTTTGHGTESLILNGGTISSANGGIWNFASPIPISGYGNISSSTGLSTVTANNATYGNAMNISKVTQTGAVTLGFSSNGTFNLSNDTFGAAGNTGAIVTFSGTTTYSQFTNPLSGTFGNNWGNVDYGLVNVTGDTTINGGITINNYYVMNITNSTLTLNNPGTINGFNTSSPPPFVLGTGGNLVINGATSFGNSAPIPINGGSITHAGGTFSANSFIGYGSISGVTSIVGGGNVTASGGTLTFDGGTGVSVGSSSGSGANFNSSASSTLDLKGIFNYINPGFIAPNGGIINLDNATINAGAWTVTMSPGTVNVLNTGATFSCTGSGSVTSNATLGIGSVATLTNNGTLNNTGTLTADGAINGTGALYNGGTLKGIGTISNNVYNGEILSGLTAVNTAGNVNPGDSPGMLTITKNYTQTTMGTLDIEIAGLTQGTQYDFLKITGTASLAGILDVSLLNSFIPAAGSQFDILDASGGISGTFNTVDFPTQMLPGGDTWSIVYTGTDVYLDVNAPVPEPSSILLVVSSLVCFVAYRKKTRTA